MNIYESCFDVEQIYRSTQSQNNWIYRHYSGAELNVNYCQFANCGCNVQVMQTANVRLFHVSGSMFPPFNVLHFWNVMGLQNSKVTHILVGSLNPFEKYARQIGSFPGVNIKNVWNHHLASCSLNRRNNPQSRRDDFGRRPPNTQW